MAHLGLAERSDLADWGKTKGAPADLPRLVRRLILETAPGLASVGFAAGEGISGSGWDGTARATAATVKVPAGLSLWELSTRGDVNRKASSDYAKRTSTPDGIPRREISEGLLPLGYRWPPLSRARSEGNMRATRSPEICREARTRQGIKPAA